MKKSYGIFMLVENVPKFLCNWDDKNEPIETLEEAEKILQGFMYAKATSHVMVFNYTIMPVYRKIKQPDLTALTTSTSTSN